MLCGVLRDPGGIDAYSLNCFVLRRDLYRVIGHKDRGQVLRTLDSASPLSLLDTQVVRLSLKVTELQLETCTCRG